MMIKRAAIIGLGTLGPGIAARLVIYKSVSSKRNDLAPVVLEKTRASKFCSKYGEGMFSYTPEQIRALQGGRARKLVAVRRILENQEQVMQRLAHGFRIGDFYRLAVHAQGTAISAPLAVPVARFTNARGTASHAG
jgi:3-hydroxyacyl-CoA dehydrogenase